MTRAALVAAMLLAAGAWAQAGSRHELSQSARPPPPQQSLFPSSLGSPYGARVPALRSWVIGWSLTGSNLAAYEVRCDEVFSDCGVPILRTKAAAGEPYGFASLTHSEPAGPWRGMRVELRAELKAGRVDGWTGLWMRIDDAQGNALAFDNMQNRALRGTTGFLWYSVVLDVPPEAERLTFGVVLHGPGAVFIRELRFEEASNDVASSDLLAPLRAQK